METEALDLQNEQRNLHDNDQTALHCRKIKPNETVELDLDCKPWKSGTSTIVATFNSKELYNLSGTRKVTVHG